MPLHFLGSSWAAFVPDLIVGVLTGAVVGAAFYAYERGAESRRQRHEARVVSSRLVQPLLLVLQRPEHLPSYESVVPIPRKLVRALSIVEQADVDLWHETSPSELTKRLLRFRSTAWDLREDADDLDQAIRSWRFLHEREAGTVDYGTAQILGATRQYLEELFPDAAQRQRLADEAQLFHANRLVKLHARKYRKAMGRTERSVASLLEELIAQIRSGTSDPSAAE